MAGVLEYVLDNGLAHLALRPLAEALGISTFKLSYHFGSKGELVQAAVQGAVAAQIDEVRSGLGTTDGSTVGTIMKRYWAWLCRTENQKATRMFFEINGLALGNSEGFSNVLEAWFSEEGLELEKRIIAHAGYRGEQSSARV